MSQNPGTIVSEVMVLRSFDPSSVAFLTDPYPVYEYLRQHDPFAEVEIAGVSISLVARYDDVRRVLKDPQAMQRPLHGDVPEILGDGPAARMFISSMSQADPPQHARQRRLSAAAFSPRAVAALQGRIDAIVAGAVNDLVRRERFDAVHDFALKIPMRVICEIMGIPEDDWPELIGWTPDALRVFMPEGSTSDELDRCHRASQFFFDYISAMIEDRRRSPRDDLTTRLVEANDEAENISHDEMCAMIRGLITAGFETTTNTIAAGFLAFAKFPDQLELLRSEPQVVESAVEELLRWEGPVQAQPRCMHTEIEFADGERFEAGRKFWLLLGSANRDRSQFDNPDVVRIDRNEGDHFSFGGGRHICLGAGLARSEIRSALRHIGRAFSAIELDGPIQRRDHFQFRGLAHLPVSVTWAPEPVGSGT
ncbi:MAG: cytochrome P450 [Ilumatobacter sp.]|uniref:cytochrome P450 n=1 Tax=Ilumatobacter sp. TaxID=1967498 RepID=UPI00391932B3